MNDNNTLLLFAENDADAARIEAVDQLHNATNFYTAEPVVERLLNHMPWPQDRGRMIDASCGDGAFVAVALARALAARVFTDAELPHHLEAWEIHPFACAQARARVTSVLISFGRSPIVAAHLAEQIVHNKDFLTDAPTVETWNYFCTNPPYLRAANIPQLLRDEYAAHVPKYALADLAHSFLDRAARTLCKGGKIGVVVADRILINSTAGPLREALSPQLGVEHVERIDSELAFVRPKQRRKGTPARVHPLLLVLGPEAVVPLTKEPIYPGVDETPYAGLPTLQDLAEIRLGPWLGTSGIFSISPEEAIAKGIPPESLVHAVDIDDIIDGDQLGPLKRYAIRTHPDHRPCDAIMAHLEATMHRMAEGGKKGTYWCPPERFHARDLSQVTLMVPRIAKTPRGIWLPPSTLAINHNLSIISGDLQMLTKIERALRGDLAAKWLRDHAPRIEGGYHTLDTSLLRKMPIQLD
jgi:hypothetical protein